MKKVMQRLFAMALCTLLLTHVMVPANAKGFTDIYNGHPYQDAINYVSDNEIMNGITPTEFAPNNAVTRAMMVTILYRKAGSPYVTIPTTGKFTDVPDTAYYAKAVYWAKDKSITNGTSTTTFSPNQTITREQAMCFLYNYSKVTTTAVNKTVSITGYSDYSSISSYARNAMAWAVANKVLIITDPNKANLYPKHTMSRVQAAYGITAFGTNVERCAKSKDLLWFQNEATEGIHFSSTEYYMENNHVTKFKTKLRQKYKDNSAYQSAVNKFDDERQPENNQAGGRCFGMCAVAALDKHGKIEYNKNFGNGAENMYNVQCTSPSWAESAISYYHLSQILTEIGTINSATWSHYPNLVLESMRSATGLSLFVFFAKFPPGGAFPDSITHAVLVNSCEKVGNNYRLNLYDPDIAGTTTWTLTYKNGYYYLPGEQFGIITAYAINDFDIFDFLDIDEYQNSRSNGISSYSLSNAELISSEQRATDITTDTVETLRDNYPEDFSTVYFRLQEGMTITNDNGETLTWKDGEFSGNMEVYGWNFITGTSPVLAYADVPLSKTFRMETAEGTQQEFSVVDKYRYQCMENFSGTAELCGDGTMELSGSFADFTATCFRPENGIKHTLSGTGSQSVRLDFTGEKVKAVGLTGAYTVQHTDAAGVEHPAEMITEVEQVEESAAHSAVGEEVN